MVLMASMEIVFYTITSTTTNTMGLADSPLVN
jgi:hypothetical protein